MISFFDSSSSEKRGSFVVAAAFFMMIFLMIGAFSIDLSRYFFRQQRTQQIADGAALTAGNTFNEYNVDNNLDRSEIIKSVIDYIKHHSSNNEGAGSYDTSVYEYSSEMTPGEYDIQYDTFLRTTGGGGDVPNGFAFTQSSGSLRTMEEDGATVKSRSPSSIDALGPARVDFNGNGKNDLVMLKDASTIKLWDEDGGSHTTINIGGNQARKQKSLLGAGTFNGQRSIFYAGSNEEKIFRVSPGNSPIEVVDHGDGSNAVAGTGDVDGDGQNELVYAGASQAVKVLEPDGTVRETGVTAGSNNGIGIGQPADFNGDGTASIPIVHGGNEIQLLGPNGVREEVMDGAASFKEAKKAPVSPVNVDGDDDPELVFQSDDLNPNDLRYIDDVRGSNNRQFIRDDSGNRVTGEDERGVVGAPLGGSTEIHHRIGVQVKTTWRSYFLPEEIFMRDNRFINGIAVAHVEPVTTYNPTSDVTVPIECGLLADQGIDIDGNNFNKNYTSQVQGTGFCSNGDVDVQDSNNGNLGDVHSGGQFHPGGGNHGDVNQNGPNRPIPEFKYDNGGHSDYDIVLNDLNYNTWPPAGGKGKGSGGREMLTKTGQKTGITVTRTSSGNFEFAKGENISGYNIYADGNLTFGGNNTVNGGIYATGNITVNKNNNTFKGDPNELGGLALWSEGDISIPQNNLTLEGLTGAEGDYSFTSPPKGGGNDSGFEGMLITGGTFSDQNNSSNLNYLLDKSLVDFQALRMNGWEENMDPPEFNRYKVYLTD